jgi:hypothetical protein
MRDAYSDVEEYFINNTKIACISVAVEIGLFEMIAAGKNNIESLSKSNKFNQHVLIAFLESLTCLKFLKVQDSIFRLTDKTKYFFLKDSKFYQGKDILLKKNENQHNRFKKALLNNGYGLEASGSSITSMWENGKIDFDTALHFSAHMQTMISYPAYIHVKNDVFRDINEIIDIGGGSGTWAKEIIQNHPDIKVSIFDLPEVIKASKQLAGENESNGEINYLEGNFFISIPGGRNYLLSNILHDWPVEKCRLILEKIFTSMDQGGKLYINECLLTEDRLSPEFTSLFNLLMAVNHEAQHFTQSELKSLIEEIGFIDLEIVSTAGSYSLLVCRKS